MRGLGCCAVHSRVDEYLADWFGLNQSKYQWALNEYLEMKNMVCESVGIFISFWFYFTFYIY